MLKLFLQILFDERGATLAMTRKTANTLITAAGFNTNMDEIEAVVNALTSANYAADSVLAAALGSDVVRSGYGLVQHTDGSLYVDLSDTYPGLELTDGGLRVKAYGIAQRTTNGLDVGRSGDLLLSSAASTPDGWTDVSATYEGKMIRISATALSTGGSDTVTLSVANLPAHTHTVTANQTSGANGAATSTPYWSKDDTTDSTTAAATSGSAGSGTAVSIVPAYVTTKMFKHN